MGVQEAWEEHDRELHQDRELLVEEVVILVLAVLAALKGAGTAWLTRGLVAEKNVATSPLSVGTNIPERMSADGMVERSKLEDTIDRIESGSSARPGQCGNCCGTRS